MRGRPHSEAMIELFREDPLYAEHLLNTILKDGDQEELMDFLLLITAALAPDQPPPTHFTLLATLRSLGLRLSVTQAPLNERPTLEEMTESVERVERWGCRGGGY